MDSVARARVETRWVWGKHLFLGLAATLFLVNLALIFFWVPSERTMGIVQRIFYFHVPLALVGFLSFAIVLYASVAYLATRRDQWDRRAHAAAEIGVLFLTTAIITGAIWAKPVWGTWWTWDPKLTTTFILWIMFVGYLMVRSFAPTRGQAARYSAVIGIIAAIDIPIVYFASVWWRTLHPGLVDGPLSETGSLESSMQTAFRFSILTFTVLFAYMFMERVGQRRTDDEVEELLTAQG